MSVYVYICVFVCVSVYMSTYVCAQCPCTVRLSVYLSLHACVYVPVCVLNLSKLRMVELTGDKEELTTEFKAKVARTCTTGVHELRTLL